MIQEHNHSVQPTTAAQGVQGVQGAWGAWGAIDSMLQMNRHDIFQVALRWRLRGIRMGATQLALALPLAAAAADGQAAGGSTPPAHSPTASREQPRVWMTIGTRRFAVTLEDNPTARAFLQLLPMTLDMPDLNGNEKHVRLPRSLPTQAERPGTLRAGDVLLYGSSTLVVFYETFDSGYSYTRIGRIADSAGLARALGSGSARITFTAP